jgi:molybdenum-dependent DNA-binding transcriptional regulator ModE
MALNEWLKLMLEEIRRKEREQEEAAREHERRQAETSRAPGSTGSADSPGPR